MGGSSSPNERLAYALLAISLFLAFGTALVFTWTFDSTKGRAAIADVIQRCGCAPEADCDSLETVFYYDVYSDYTYYGVIERDTGRLASLLRCLCAPEDVINDLMRHEGVLDQEVGYEYELPGCGVRVEFGPSEIEIIIR